jgi:hypothetical protein
MSRGVDALSPTPIAIKDEVDHINITAHARGGHFIPWEIPEQWTADPVRTFTSQSNPRPA